MAIFEETDDNPIFKNRSVFTKDYIPKSILHRDKQIKQIADGLRYILQGQRPTDQAIYGKRGTGKTLVARYVADELCKVKSTVRIFYVSLKHAKTGFMAIGKMVDKIIGFGPNGKSLVKGNSFNDGFNLIFDYVKSLNEDYIIFILDEMNKLEDPDIILHMLLRLNESYGDMKGKTVTYIFISNTEIAKDVSEGTKSSFTSVTKRVFPPYNANDLRDILTERVQEGLKPGVCDEKIIALCAAYGAQEEGDARRTIEMLGKAAEIAVEERSDTITEYHVKRAREQIDFDAVAETLLTLPAQLKAVALACIWDIQYAKDANYISTTGSVYNEYKDIARRTGIEIMTQRRVTDLLNELSEIGFIDTIVMYGRGRTKHITLLVPPLSMQKVLLDDFRLKSLQDYKHLRDH